MESLFCYLLFLQNFIYILPCIGIFIFRNLFRRTGRHNRTSFIAALRSDVNDMIGGFDHVQIMFDHDHSIPVIHVPDTAKFPLIYEHLQNEDRLSVHPEYTLSFRYFAYSIPPQA